MSYIFENATLLTYDLNKNYSRGENLLISTTKNLKLNGILYNRYINSDAQGVKETYSGILNILNNNTGQYEEIIVNNYHLGYGRIVNISFPKENPIFVEDYIYSIEIVESGNFNTLPVDNKYGSGLNSINNKLLNLSETLNFNHLQNGKYSYDHNLDIQFYNDESDIILKSKNLANSIYNDSGVYLGLFGKFSGFYNDLMFKQNVIQENYDLINKSVSFQKNIQIDENYKTNYSLELTNTSSRNAEGILTVTENGKILGLQNTDEYTAKKYLNTEISSSFDRCNTLAVNYYSSSVNNEPFTLGTTFDKYTNNLSYNISYTDNINFYSGLIHMYEITLEQGNDGINYYTRNGNVKLTSAIIGQISKTSDDFLKFKSIYQQALNDYSDYKLMNTSNDFNIIYPGNINNVSYGKGFSYSIKKTNDGFLLTGTAGIEKYVKRLEIGNQYDDLSLMTKEYILPNKDDKNFYFSQGKGAEQVQLSNTNSSIKGVLIRPTGNQLIWASGFIDYYLSGLKDEVLKNIKNIGEDHVLNSASLTYDSNLNFGLDLNILSVKLK
jgi:hypothetical protein